MNSCAGPKNQVRLHGKLFLNGNQRMPNYLFHTLEIQCQQHLIKDCESKNQKVSFKSFLFAPLPGQRCTLVTFSFRKGQALSRLLSNGNSLMSGQRPEKIPLGSWGVRERPERLFGIGCDRKIFSLLKIESTKSKIGFQVIILYVSHRYASIWNQNWAADVEQKIQFVNFRKSSKW